MTDPSALAATPVTGLSPVDLLAKVREAAGHVPPGPWTVSETHGHDIADECWSEARIVAPDGTPLALTYSTFLNFEPQASEEVEAFITTASVVLPRLLAVAENALAGHNQITENGEQICDDCTRSDRGAAHWPCPAVQQIEAALTGQPLRWCPRCGSPDLAMRYLVSAGDNRNRDARCTHRWHTGPDGHDACRDFAEFLRKQPAGEDGS